MTASLSTPVLVLNKNWVALSVTTARQAMIHLISGEAEVIDIEKLNDKEVFNQYDFSSWYELSKLRDEFEPDNSLTWLQCVRDRLVIPYIIRLLDFSKTNQGRIRLTRRNIYARDKNHCQYCGKRFKTSELSLDHVLPSSRGGKTEWTNLVCCCVACNRRKANRTPEEAKMKLLSVPKKISSPLAACRIRHDSWKKFLDAAYWDIELED